MQVKHHQFLKKFITFTIANMKFQSSKASVTPIQGYSNAYYCNNQYIPTTSVLDFEASTTNDEANEEKDNESFDDDDCNGRVLRYETVTITSPVLSSARLVDRTSKQRYVTENDVNELNDKLQSLLLNTRNDEKEEDDDDENDTNINRRCGKPTKNVPVVELTQRDNATTTYFGRCSFVVYNSVTQNFVEVVRSARLAFTSSA